MEWRMFDLLFMVYLSSVKKRRFPMNGESTPSIIFYFSMFYTTPCASIALATFMKPAMLAPLT